MDPIDHPDLLHLDQLLSRQLEDTLSAEMYAARVAARRRRTMRDLLLELEDRAVGATLTLSTGAAIRGTVVAVGLDHAEVESGDRTHAVAIDHIVSVGT